MRTDSQIQADILGEHIAGVTGVSNIGRIRNREQRPVAFAEVKTRSSTRWRGTLQ
jgi:hypothetical protein